MDMELKDRFLTLWTKHFNGAHLPICLFYSNDESNEQLLRPLKGRMCLIGKFTGTVNIDEKDILKSKVEVSITLEIEMIRK